jgi:hypothetical protein
MSTDDDDSLDDDEHDPEHCPMCDRPSHVVPFKCTDHPEYLDEHDFCAACDETYPTIEGGGALDAAIGRAPSLSAARRAELRGTATSCARCSRPFCHAMLTTFVAGHAGCPAGITLAPVASYRAHSQVAQQVGAAAFGGNASERQVTQRLLAHTGTSVGAVFDVQLRRLDAGELVVPGMPLGLGLGAAGAAGAGAAAAGAAAAPPKALLSTDSVCSLCMGAVWDEMLYGFREAEQHNLPAELQRPDCWYGRNCRTQRHNHNHARKLNHVCKQRKF